MGHSDISDEALIKTLRKGLLSSLLMETAAKRLEELLNEKKALKNKLSNAYIPEYKLYDPVYITDYFDVKNNCSQMGNGSSSDEIELKTRKCFITQITIAGKNEFLYYVQPCELSEKEQDGTKYFFWQKSFSAKELCPDMVDKVKIP